MGESDNNPAQESDAEARAREAAFASFQRSGADDGPLFVPVRRSAFPPSFFLILAAGCAFLALEPSADLRYELFGPSQAIDLGRPGAYALDAATDGARVRIAGYAGSVRGTFTHWGDSYEVVPLIGIPVLVRRAPHPAAAPDSAEPLTGEGRLLRLDDTPSTWFERLARPAARYTTVRLQFEALNQLPSGSPAWLLLDGDVPRSDVWAVAEPILLWIAALVFAFLAWRAYGLRSTRAARMRI